MFNEIEKKIAGICVFFPRVKLSKVKRSYQSQNTTGLKLLPTFLNLPNQPWSGSQKILVLNQIYFIYKYNYVPKRCIVNNNMRLVSITQYFFILEHKIIVVVSDGGRLRLLQRELSFERNGNEGIKIQLNLFSHRLKKMWKFSEHKRSKQLVIMRISWRMALLICRQCLSLFSL